MTAVHAGIADAFGITNDVGVSISYFCNIKCICTTSEEVVRYIHGITSDGGVFHVRTCIDDVVTARNIGIFGASYVTGNNTVFSGVWTNDGVKDEGLRLASIGCGCLFVSVISKKIFCIIVGHKIPP